MHSSQFGSEYYGTIAKEVYAAAKREGWTSIQVKDMLKNPKEFEKYLIRVSKLIFLLIVYRRNNLARVLR